MGKITLFFSCLLLCFTSCSKSEKKNMTLRLCSDHNFYSFDPRVAADGHSQGFIRLLFQGLTTYGEKGKVEFAVAKKVNISEDRCHYTFTLDKTYWNNGDLVTAYDFERAWKTVISLEFPSRFSYAFNMIKNVKKYRKGLLSLEEVKIKATNASELVVELEFPAPYFLELTANPVYSPVHSSFYQEGIDLTDPKNLVTNGSYNLEKWALQNEVVFVKNKKSPKQVFLDKITCCIVEDNNTALLMYENDEIDWVGFPLSPIPIDAVPSYKNSKDYYVSPGQIISWLLINVDKPPLSNLNIRKALCTCLNRKELAQSLEEENLSPAYGILPSYLAVNPDPLFEDNNIEKARALLQKGLEEEGLTLETMPPISLIKRMTSDGSRPIEAILEYWKKHLGIKVKLDIAELKGLIERMKAKEYCLCSSAWESWINDPTYNLGFLKLDNKNIPSEYKRLMKLCDYTKDLKLRKNYLQQTEKYLMDNLYVLPLFFTNKNFLMKKRVKGLYFTASGLPIFNKIKIEN